MSADPQTQIQKTLKTENDTKNQSTIKQITPLQVIWKIMEMLKASGKENSKEYLLHQEKLLYFHMKSVEDLSDENYNNWDFTQELKSFIQNILNTYQDYYYEKQDHQNAINILIKGIDMLMHKSIHKYIRPIQILGELKVNIFNQLSQIYQEKRQFQFALKSITYAYTIEKKLVQDNYKNHKISIINTVLNKVAILSGLQRHDKALQTLQQAQQQIDYLEFQYLQQQEQQDNTQQEGEQGNQQEEGEQGQKIEKEKLTEDQMSQVKYLKMIAYYNAGAENEHLYHKDKANQKYQIAYNIAKEIQDQEMTDRLGQVLGY